MQWLALLVLIAVAFALRLFDLDRTGLWEDEAWSWFQSRQSFADMMAATAHDNYPPLHNIILHFFIRVFGDSEVVLRMPSVLLGTVAVWLTYRVGTVLWDRTTGLLACLLITFSGFHIWYSQEARMYALLSCTATYYVLTVIQATRRPTRKNLYINALAGVLLLFSHIYGSFIFIGLNLFVLASLYQQKAWLSVKWKDWLIAQTMAAVIFSPWALILFERANRIRDVGFWIPDLSARLVLGGVSVISGGVAAFIVFFVLVLIAVSSLKGWCGQLSAADNKHIASTRFFSVFAVDWRLGLVLTWLFSSLLFGIITSVVIDQNILHSRYLSGSLPAFLLLAAVGMSKLQHSKPLRIAVLVIVMVASSPAIKSSLTERVRSGAREAIAVIRPQLSADDQIYVYHGWRVHVFQYYLRDTGIQSHAMATTDSISHWVPRLDHFWLLTAHLDESESSELQRRAKLSHELAYSLVHPKSQAYFFVKKAEALVE